MSDYYILDNGKPKQVSDLMEWALWFEQSSTERIVKRTKIGASEVSTVFLGLDHAFDGGPPLLYETMIFGGKLKGEMRRYFNLEDAQNGHAQMCEKVTAAG